MSGDVMNLSGFNMAAGLVFFFFFFVTFQHGAALPWARPQGTHITINEHMTT